MPSKRPHAQEPSPALPDLFDAGRERRSSTGFATLSIMRVFLPLFFLGGVEGRLLVPLGLSYLASLGASLVVALTVTPALSVLLLARALHDEKRRVCCAD